MASRAAQRRLGIDVLTAAKHRIARVFDDFARVYVSFSGGKDSGVLLELAAREARRRGRRLGVLFVVSGTPPRWALLEAASGGVSPHARGAAPVRIRDLVDDRVIPAYAGSKAARPAACGLWPRVPRPYTTRW